MDIHSLRLILLPFISSVAARDENSILALQTYSPWEWYCVSFHSVWRGAKFSGKSHFDGPQSSSHHWLFISSLAVHPKMFERHWGNTETTVEKISVCMSNMDWGFLRGGMPSSLLVFSRHIFLLSQISCNMERWPLLTVDIVCLALTESPFLMALGLRSRWGSSKFWKRMLSWTSLIKPRGIPATSERMT